MDHQQRHARGRPGEEPHPQKPGTPPAPEPRKEPMRDAERDRFGSRGQHRDAAGRERREDDTEHDEYGDFLREGKLDGAQDEVEPAKD
jgi:hypothetical protein